MTDGDFERWMERMAAESPPAAVSDSAAIWWRAQLRRSMAEQERLTRPARIAEQVACVVCLAAAAAAGASVGVAGVAPFIVVTLVAAAAATAFVLRGAAD